MNRQARTEHAPIIHDRVAVIGSGISGLAAAWLLSRDYDITVFESANYLGGHTNTVDICIDGLRYPVDTGFLVFNERTYPNLINLFKHLDVDSVCSDMSFSVSLENPSLEWSGTNLATLFGQKRNLLRPQFWRMLSDTLRFNKESLSTLNDLSKTNVSLKDFLSTNNYSDSFCNWYLLPMAAAIWSCPTEQMLNMPVQSFVRFCHNHGLLQISDRPKWRTVKGGGKEYVRKIANTLHDIRMSCEVKNLKRSNNKIQLEHSNGTDTFDKVIMACHTNQTLDIGGSELSQGQKDILNTINYQSNRAVLHTDQSLLPKDKSLWSAWNYFAGSGNPGLQPVGVSYLINKLQPIPFNTPVIVTLNPAREPDPNKVISEFDYEHPVLGQSAISAQNKLDSVQGDNNIWLAGAWTGYGFHEDGLKSAIRVANDLGVQAPWQRQSELALYDREVS